jgi:hypothetical protein
VKNGSGLFAVMVRYADQIAVFHGTVPHPRKGPANRAAIWSPNGGGWASSPRRPPATARSSAGFRSTSAARCPRPRRSGLTWPTPGRTSVPG